MTSLFTDNLSGINGFNFKPLKTSHCRWLMTYCWRLLIFHAFWPRHVLLLRRTPGLALSYGQNTFSFYFLNIWGPPPRWGKKYCRLLRESLLLYSDSARSWDPHLSSANFFVESWKAVLTRASHLRFFYFSLWCKTNRNGNQFALIKFASLPKFEFVASFRAGRLCL